MVRDVRLAAARVRAGGIVGYATEACFGLGCDPRRVPSLRRLLRLKRRVPGKGLILLACDERALARYAVSLPGVARASWPGPHTWLVGANRKTLALVRGRHTKVAVRITAHRQARALAQACGGAIVSTSANRAGERPVKSARELARRFGTTLDAILIGRTGGGARPTSIRDAESGRYLRR